MCPLLGLEIKLYYLHLPRVTSRNVVRDITVQAVLSQMGDGARATVLTLVSIKESVQEEDALAIRLLTQETRQLLQPVGGGDEGAGHPRRQVVHPGPGGL